MYYGAPGLLGLGIRQLNCHGLYDRGGLMTRRLPSLFSAHNRSLCFEDPTFSIGVFCHLSWSTVNCTWFIPLADGELPYEGNAPMMRRFWSSENDR